MGKMERAENLGFMRLRGDWDCDDEFASSGRPLMDGLGDWSCQRFLYGRPAQFRPMKLCLIMGHQNPWVEA